MVAIREPTADRRDSIPLERADELLRKWDAIIGALDIAGATACAEMLRLARKDLLALIEWDELPF